MAAARPRSQKEKEKKGYPTVKDIIRQLRDQDMLEYTSFPFWSWNNELDDDELLAQIRAMKDVGIRGFIMHARTGLKVEYLSERWFHFIEICLDEAKKQGMRALIYDENGWPSGFVGGRLLENPDNLAQYLRYEVRPAFDETAFAVYTVADGVAARVTAPAAGVDEYHCVYLKSSPANTDILNPDVVSQFIDATYAEYYRRFADRFGKELMGFFTDEPQYYRWETPYTRVAAPIWTQRYGGDIRDGLVYLFIESEAGYVFRTRYYTLLNELYTTNYYKRLYDWCVEHHCEFTGHSVEESNLSMQMWGGAGVMPSYEYETIPGIDHLGRAPAAQLSAKQVGSVAQQLEKKHVLTETFGCSGWDADPRRLRLIGDAQYVRGVNQMCQHLSSYSLKGQGKLDHPPCFSRHMTWWKEYAAFNRYFDRLGYLVANSRELVNAVVIHPMASVYLDYIRTDEGRVAELDKKFAALYTDLTAHAVSYHLADEHILARHGSVEEGAFRVGACRYHSVILPYCRSLSASTKKLLQDFVAAGGHVYAYDALPAYTDGAPDDYSFITEKLADHYDDLAAGEAIRLKLSAPIPYAYREGEGFRLLFFVNETDGDAAVTLPDAPGFATLDLDTLQVTASEKTFTLPAGKSRLLLADCPARAARRYADGEIDITDRFVFEAGDDNALPLDTVSISTDGEHYDSPHHVYEVFERLVRADYQGALWVKYSFAVKELCSRMKLRTESGGQLSFALNGHTLEMLPSSYDVFFQEANIADCLQEGVNELVCRLDWRQGPHIRYALFDPEATESLRNCLAFDTEVEPVYLLGNFKVDETRAIVADDALCALQDIPGSGYKYFCGSKTFGACITAEKAHALLTLTGNYMVCGLQVNGVPQAASVLDNVLPLTLEKGQDNYIELTVTSSLRNLYGPHHLGCEPGGVDPSCFTMRGTWKDGESPRYHADYHTVPFGLTAVTLRYEK